MYGSVRHQESHRDRKLIDEVFSIFDILLTVENYYPEWTIELTSAISLINLVVIFKDKSLIPGRTDRVLTAVTELSDVAISLVLEIRWPRHLDEGARQA